MRYQIVCVSCSILLIVGCSGKPKAIRPPSISAGSVVDDAFSAYDTNGDQSLDQEELQKCPGLLAALSTVDSDDNGAVSEAELKSRLEAMAESTTGIFPVECQFIYQGRPVSGAKVILEPASFLADTIEPAEGITDEIGATAPKCVSLPNGVQFGMYTVRVEGGTPSLPAKYNSESEIGMEVSHQAKGIVTGTYRFDLK